MEAVHKRFSVTHFSHFPAAVGTATAPASCSRALLWFDSTPRYHIVCNLDWETKMDVLGRDALRRYCGKGAKRPVFDGLEINWRNH